jgi:hypothetical protein
MIGVPLLLAVALAASPLHAGEAPEPSARETEETSPAEASVPDRVAPYVQGQREYAQLRIDPGGRTHPDAEDRLVVFHGGRPVLDLGLRNERTIVPAGAAQGGALLEEGTIDSAEISTDGRSAAILSTHYRRAAAQQDAADSGEPPPPMGDTTITFVDARHPAARFTVSIERDRWVKEVIAPAGGRGLAVSTTAGLNAPADLEIFGPDGRSVFRIPEEEASVKGVTATNNGAFLAADLAYPAHKGLPDRGVMVLDLLQGNRWTYKWSYGADDEPTSWSLDESGILELRFPGRVARYDKSGALLGSARVRKGKRTPAGKR